MSRRFGHSFNRSVGKGCCAWDNRKNREGRGWVGAHQKKIPTVGTMGKDLKSTQEIFDTQLIFVITASSDQIRFISKRIIKAFKAL